MTSLPCSSSSQISMLHDRMGKPSIGDGSALFDGVSDRWLVAHCRRMRSRMMYVHGLLVGDELNPSLDLRDC